MLIDLLMASSSVRKLVKPPVQRGVAGLVLLVAFLSCGVGRGALLTDFSGSFAQYQAAGDSAADFDLNKMIDGYDFLTWQRGTGHTSESNNGRGDANADKVVGPDDLSLWRNTYNKTPGGAPESVCFKLYFDPAGILEGQVTLSVDAPPGSNRFALGIGNGLIAADPRFDFDVVESIVNVGGRERYEAKVSFMLKAGEEVPDKPITLFGYQVQDLQPQQPAAPVQNGFEFKGDDFILIQNEDLTTTLFTEAQLADVPLPLNVPLTLDVDTATGLVNIRNSSGATINMTYYEITSAAGSLNPAGWLSLDDAEGSDPPGVGWDEAGGVGAQALAESNLTGSLAINSTQSQSLGAAFQSSSPIRDLRFHYATPSGAFITGVVNYSAAVPIGAVPEPVGGGLSLIGLTCLAVWRRRKGQGSEAIRQD
jgi:hypothetical protein